MSAGQLDPIEAIEAKARTLALQAMDEGWSGPPFDPVELAKLCGLKVDARGDIPDARLVPDNGKLRIEYNPTRPRGRLRFSIAHEIAHTLFPDCKDEIRHRSTEQRGQGDSWQLEVLCNIAAAELLMPLGSFSQFTDEALSIDSVMELRKEYDVSVEACLIRLVKLANRPAAAFCASHHAKAGYKIDYVIPAAGWDSPIRAGELVPKMSAVEDANAIGYTAKRDEEWNGNLIRVECVGLAPYPGTVVPRVVGLILPRTSSKYTPPTLEEVRGNVLEPRGDGPKIIAHVVPNTKALWGGRGVAAAVRKRYPSSYEAFKSITTNAGRLPTLGEVVIADVGDDINIAHMVAQRGFGPSTTPRLSYTALSSCLSQVRLQAQKTNASVHLPQVGTGHGGAKWNVIRELLIEELVGKGIRTIVYTLPDRN